MPTPICVPVSPNQFLDLANFLKRTGDPRSAVEIVSLAIDYWLNNADRKPELLAQTENRGYQWKNLFLPDGTQIRMHYKGSYSYAKVEGDALIFKGQPTSPARLANAVAGSNRNAWRDLWIKRPEDKEWMLAEEFRSQVKHLADELLKELGDFPSIPDEKA